MKSQEPDIKEIEETLKKLGQRIGFVAEEVGGKRALAEMIGLSEGQIYRYIKGENMPGVDVLVKIAIASGVSIEWLATGNSRKVSITSADVEQTNPPEKRGGFFCLDGDKVIGFRLEWLLEKVGTPEHLQLLQINTDEGMGTTLGVNSLVIIDSSERDVTHGVYRFCLKDGTTKIKRLQSLTRDTIKVISDNAAYAAYTVSTEDLTILGKVIWIAKNLDC